jgi:hypothetical protein
MAYSFRPRGGPCTQAGDSRISDELWADRGSERGAEANLPVAFGDQVGHGAEGFLVG